MKAEQSAALIDAVITSVRTRDEDPVIKLLEMGVDVDTKDAEGCTPLIIASRDNRPSIVKIMLSRKANVHAKTRLGATALFAAATHGHTGARAYAVPHVRFTAQHDCLQPASAALTKI